MIRHLIDEISVRSRIMVVRHDDEVSVRMEVHSHSNVWMVDDPLREDLSLRLREGMFTSVRATTRVGAGPNVILTPMVVEVPVQVNTHVDILRAVGRSSVLANIRQDTSIVIYLVDSVIPIDIDVRDTIQLMFFDQISSELVSL